MACLLTTPVGAAAAAFADHHLEIFTPNVSPENRDRSFAKRFTPHGNVAMEASTLTPRLTHLNRELSHHAGFDRLNPYSANLPMPAEPD